MKADFTAGEASRLAGFKKPWMLGHLERERIFVREYYTDRRHGRARKYTFSDIVILRAINRMLELGARPARIKSVISALGSLDGLSNSYREALRFVKCAGTTLFVTDQHAYFVKSAEEIVDLSANGQLAFSFMIDVEQSLRPVVRAIDQYRRVRISNWKSDKATLDRLCEAEGL